MDYLEKDLLDEEFDNDLVTAGRNLTAAYLERNPEEKTPCGMTISDLIDM